MYFEKLEINNFRGIRRAVLENLGNINLILGKNNSLKTSVLEALFFLVGMANPEIMIRVHSFRDLILNQEDDFRFIFHQLEYDNPPVIKAQTGTNAYREIKISPQFRDTSSGEIKRIKSLDDKGGDVTFDTSYSDKHIAELNFDFTIKEFHKSGKKFNSKLIVDNRNLAISQPKGYIEELKGVYVTPKINLSANLVRRLEDMLVNKRDKEIINILKIVDASIVGVKFGTGGMIYFDCGMNRLIPLNLVGDGIRRLLAIILAMYDAKNGIVMIDEIENGLHFSALKKLWETVILLSHEFNIQVFVSSHNIETLKYLNEAVKERFEHLPSIRENVRSYTFRRMDDNTLKSYKYDFEKFNYSIDQGIEIR